MRCRSGLWWGVLSLPPVVLLLWCAENVALAQEGAAPQSTLFASDEPLQFRLEAPFSKVFRDRIKPDPDYQDGRLAYTDAGGAEQATDLRVRVRGRSRAANCAFPPLLLNFPAELTTTPFVGQNRLKLVTHCDPNGVYEQYLWLEYLAYRVLNVVTDTSLRARVVQVVYYDSERGREIANKPGLLIEDEERFAARQGLAVVPDERIDRARYDRGALALVEMFEYFIGNTDWSALGPPANGDCCHNIVPFARADGVLVPVPYDFDSAGIVNKPDAMPHEALPIRDVRQRLYRGPCRDLAEIEASFEPFQRRRAEIRALYEGEARLTKQRVASALSYIDDFYAVLTEPAQIEKAFRFPCTG